MPDEGGAIIAAATGVVILERDATQKWLDGSICCVNNVSRGPTVADCGYVAKE
jgi:hypothetical protein